MKQHSCNPTCHKDSRLSLHLLGRETVRRGPEQTIPEQSEVVERVGVAAVDRGEVEEGRHSVVLLSDLQIYNLALLLSNTQLTVQQDIQDEELCYDAVRQTYFCTLRSMGFAMILDILRWF